jgi:hypothetical protein
VLQSLRTSTEPAMNRQLAILGLCLVIAAPALMAQTVYQWKDAKGVTHYSDAPPPKGAQRRELHTKDGTPAVQGSAPAADNAACAQSRLNLARLQSTAEVGLDANGDGKIDAPMDAAARAKQIERVNAAIKATCPDGK